MTQIIRFRCGFTIQLLGVPPFQETPIDFHSTGSLFSRPSAHGAGCSRSVSTWLVGPKSKNTFKIIEQDTFFTRKTIKRNNKK